MARDVRRFMHDLTDHCVSGMKHPNSTATVRSLLYGFAVFPFRKFHSPYPPYMVVAALPALKCHGVAAVYIISWPLLYVDIAIHPVLA